MNAPDRCHDAQQDQREIMLIVADVIEQERGAFAEQVTPQSKQKSNKSESGIPSI